MADMQQMEREHEQLHGPIREIVNLTNSGNAARAERECGDIESLSDSIVHTLMAVELKVAS